MGGMPPGILLGGRKRKRPVEPGVVGRLRCGDAGSALRELEAGAGAGLAVLLALDLAGVTGEVPGVAEGGLEVGVEADEGAGDAEADGLGLAR
jgi:hypothetical protein